MPKAYKQLRDITTRLEKNYRDVQDFEFTIQDERLFMLQTRSGKRTGYAAVVIATDMVKERLITPKEAVLLVDPGVAVAAAGAGVRSQGMGEAPGRDQRAAGLAGRRLRARRVHRGRRGGAGGQRRPGHPRAPRDRARRHPRHVGVAGRAHGHRRHDVARGGRRPADGEALGCRAPASSRSTSTARRSASGSTRFARATSSRSTGSPAKSRSRRSRRSRARFCRSSPAS